MFEISRDMFNKNIERALTVYVIPMPASLTMLRITMLLVTRLLMMMILTMMLVTDEIDSVEDNDKDE